MAERDFKRKLTAILSADVEGYSRLMGEDEDETIRTLTTYRELMSTLIQKHRGRVVDSPGDNLLADFGSVVDAVRCAVEIQEELRVRNAELPENRKMAFRIGINLGDVVEEGERIYGDGVNIAARVEGLAVGGGICISGAVYDNIKNKLSLSYESLGEHTVKNITEPVRVYRMRVGPEAAAPTAKEKKVGPKRRRWAAPSLVVAFILVICAATIWNFYLRHPSIEPASIDRMAHPLPDEPSIAILPFTNMSGDPEQDYIGDGLSENIISALSITPKLFVIARNSSFSYQGRNVKVQQIAEDLGVQYVLEGSIQKSGDRIRVTAQLIDALTGHHLWSEVYNRKMKDLFDMQDKITKKIVVSLQVELTAGEIARIVAGSTDDLEAWKHMMKGIPHAFRNVAKAREHFEAALRLDPEFGSAITWLAWITYFEAAFGGSDSPSLSFAPAIALAEKALKLKKPDYHAHSVLAAIYLSQRQYEKSIAENKKAIALIPNFAQGYGYLSGAMHYSGQFEESISLYKKAFRLDPKLLPGFLRDFTRSLIFLGRYEEALDAIRQMEEHAWFGRIQRDMPLQMYSFVYQEQGREEEARTKMAEALKLAPYLSLEFIKNNSLPYKNPAHLHRMLDAYRKAGMPEKSRKPAQ